MTHRSTSDAKDMKALWGGGQQSHQERSLEPPPCLPEASSPVLRTGGTNSQPAHRSPWGRQDPGTGPPSTQRPQSRRPEDRAWTTRRNPGQMPAAPGPALSLLSPRGHHPGCALTNHAGSSFLISHFQSAPNQVYSLQLIFLNVKFLLIFTTTTLGKELAST